VREQVPVAAQEQHPAVPVADHRGDHRHVNTGRSHEADEGVA
jgi:hypothetical protein